MARAAHHPWIVSFMNTVSLSVSRPSNGMGSARCITPSTWLSSPCSRNRSGAVSVQPLEISVSVNVWMKRPCADGPECATRSASKKPGAGLSQSAKVRIDTAAFTAADGGARLRRLAPFRNGSSRRSIVAALIASTPNLIGGSRLAWPWRSIASTRTGSITRRRLLQIRSDASHKTSRAASTASL